MSEEEMTPRAAEAVLRQVLDRCKRLRDRPGLEEADLREALYWLKLASDLTDPVFIIEGTAVDHPLLSEVMQLMETLMRPLKSINPALTNWDRAVDPKYAVVTRSSRRGGASARDFNPSDVKRNFREETARILRALPSHGEATTTATAEVAGRQRKEPGETHLYDDGRAGTVQRSPVPAPRGPSAEPEPARGLRQDDFSVPPPRGPGNPEGTGPLRPTRPGDFLMPNSEGEGRDARVSENGLYRHHGYIRDEDTTDEYYVPSRRRRARGRREPHYGHQEDDMEFFTRQFEETQDALQRLNLGDKFRYPSDQAFKRFFPVCDFQKAMKTGGLPKFDGSVRGYPGFRSNFYNMVYVQREHYLTKLLALEYMVPDKVKRSLFHGLQNTIQDFGHRITRLEEEFGGSERQVQYLVDLLDKARKRSSRLPYVELRELVREVQAHLDRTEATTGDAEMLVVMLKSLIPQHIKAQFKTKMMLMKLAPTGNNFIAYLLRELTEEIQAQETDPRRPNTTAETEVKDKTKPRSPKVLGKFYHAGKNDTPSQSEDEVGEVGAAQVGIGKKEWPPCPCCQTGNHGLHNCRKFFLVYSIKEKATYVKQHKVCHKCLRVEHELKDCPFKARPDCRFCASPKHHYLLCPGGEEVKQGHQEVARGEAEPVEGLGFENLGELISKKDISTFQMMAHIVAADGKLIPVNILPDTGSTHNILERKAAVRAGLTGFECKYRVTGHGGHVTEHQAICGELTLVNPKVPENRAKIKFYSYANPCGEFFPEDWSKLKGGWPHLKGLDIPGPVPDQPIELILGCSNLQLFEGVKPSSLRGLEDPVARLTHLGWMIGGRTRPEPTSDAEGEARVVHGEVGMMHHPRVSASKCSYSKHVRSLSCLAGVQVRAICGMEDCERDYEDLRRNMRRLWELETEEEMSCLKNKHYPAIRSGKQKQAEAMLLNNMKRVDQGKYQTRLLWKSEARPHNNYSAAKKAYLQWEERLKADQTTHDAYHYAMKQWIDCQYLEQVENIPNDSQNFLTGFMVLKEGQPVEKGRLVVNGARKFKGESLNDFLEPGENVINDIGDLLLKLRRYKYVVSCDLASMFLNIKVDPQDRPFLRMFYRPGPGENLQVYQFTVHAFGLTSSPYVAISCVRLHAKRHADRWPLAEEAVRKNSLVDDIWFMSDSKAELGKGIEEIQDLMASMSIEVHKWGSNCSELLENFPPEKKAQLVQLTEDKRETIKALGILWDTEQDVFLFPRGPPVLQPWTLRSMTSAAGQLFDPSGLVSPTTLPAKLIIQHTWRYQDQWDDEVPDTLAKKMTLYCENQVNLHKVEIPRHLGGEQGKGRLVIFTDSSTLAQAAAAYWITESNGQLEANLMASKLKVTGMRQHEHIGRLELVAAVLGVKLAEKISRAFQLDMRTVLFFTDSMAVLYWLSTTMALSPYTGHRVAKIGERTEFSQWKYVHTSQNPSDLPTRGMRAGDLAKCELWWKGPPFLRLPESEWPIQPIVRATESAAAETRTVEEIAQLIVMTGKKQTHTGRLQLAKKLYEKIGNVRRTLVLLQRLSDLFHKKFKHVGFRTTIRDWEAEWVHYEQSAAFPKLHRELSEQKRPSELLDLDPRMDQEGIIRVNTGLEKSVYHDWEMTFPILMKKDMLIAQDYVRYAHRTELAHLGGINTLMSKIKRRFHVIGLRELATATIHDCFRCAKKSWRPLKIPPPAFHETRMHNVQPSRAFTEIGIDHMGPFQLKQGRSVVEGYVLVIACCATRAVNLEMSMSTGADHVVAALQRHTGVYGPANYINSDQAPGFVKARRIIQDKVSLLSSEGWVNLEGPKWQINVPYSPTWSSHVEAMVKITKNALKNLHTGPTLTKLTPDEFYMQLKRCQGYINMRPLMNLQYDKPPLTPADFIGTGATWLASFVYVPEDKGALGYRYEQLEELRKKLWGTFRTEYVSWLRRQNPGFHNPLPAINDLVLVKDVPAWKGDGWPVARVVAIRGGNTEPRVYDLEIVPTEELRKKPQMVNTKKRLLLNKKVITRNYRQLGILPKIDVMDNQLQPPNNSDNGEIGSEGDQPFVEGQPEEVIVYMEQEATDVLPDQ